MPTLLLTRKWNRYAETPTEPRLRGRWGRQAKTEYYLQKVIDFRDGHAGAAILARDDRGIGTRRQGRNQCRLEVVLRRHPSRDDLGGLTCVILPVVVGHEERAITIVKLQRRI